MTAAIALGISSAGIAHADDQSSDTANERLQGRWQIVSGVNQGRELSKQELDGSTVSVTANLIVTYDRDQQQRFQAVFTVDDSQDPMHITMTSVPETARPSEVARDKQDRSADQAEKMTSSGILKFDGKNRWVLCYALPGAERPTEFKSPKGSKIMLFTLQKDQGDPVPGLGKTIESEKE
ncbi:signal peptide protein [Rhodopirellula maiorica SM1]|uniref:Signal peptide protein n=2 Tax=Novipirellula TaxID=2795426 RepID=M5RJ74_9BACT|nr:signal peptide protein [Rhodopirellula maiorica SM1]